MRPQFLRRILRASSSFLILVALCFPSVSLAQGGVIEQEPEFVPGEVIVKLKGKSKSVSSQAFVGRAVAETGLSLKGSWSGMNMHHLSFKTSKANGKQKVKELIEQLSSDPEVEYVEPNYIVRRQTTGVVEGPTMTMAQARSVSASADVGAMAFTQTGAPIQAPQGWAAQSGGLSPVVVAVIDTGVDINHSVFVNSGAIWVNTRETPNNGIDDDNNGYVDDYRGWNFAYGTNNPADDDGHGTHVAGIILGATQDITATSISPAVIRIMPLKFLDSNGSGTTADAVKAIYYAANMGAKVMNNSWGGSGYSQSLVDAITYAYNAKVAFIAAAGNSARNNDSSPTYPSNYTVPSLISVASTTDADALSSFSNYGSSTVYMGAPGSSIYSTLPGDMWGRMSGTSMATPFVAGVAAMMIREQPTMSGYQVKTLLASTGNSISSLSSKTSTRARLNAYNSVVAAKGATVDSSQPAYSASSSRSPSSAGEIGGCGLVAKAIYDSSKGGGGGLSGPQKNVAFFALLLVLLAPILLSLGLRNRSGKYQRRYQRYQIDSQVKLRFGDRELVGKVSTISLGGLQLNTDAWLEKGGIVKMSIRSPDGAGEIEVEGKVVWSEEQKRYGVAFANADGPVLSTIGRWTNSLLKV